LIENGFVGSPLTILSADCLEAELAHGGAVIQGLCQIVSSGIFWPKSRARGPLSLCAPHHFRTFGAASAAPQDPLHLNPEELDMRQQESSIIYWVSSRCFLSRKDPGQSHFEWLMLS
jgi:hypothetical protein